ncbi:hypothetical protein D3C81_1288290 [compost metagenome]
MRHGRGGGELAAPGDRAFHAIRGKDFQCVLERRLRQCVGVHAEVQRAVDVMEFAVVADRLADRQHMPFVEAALERDATVSGGAEGDPLRRLRRVGTQVDVGGEQVGHVDQRRGGGRLSGEGIDGGAHGRSPSSSM